MGYYREKGDAEYIALNHQDYAVSARYFARAIA